jgi:predicted DNA-binding transcriptional regulator AlpA
LTIPSSASYDRSLIAVTDHTRSSSGVSDVGAISMLGISRATFYRRLQDGTITPPAGRVGKRRRLWTLAEIALAQEQLQASKERK